MSQTTHRPARRRIPAAVTNRLVEGAFAACLGLAAIAMLVLLLWITSPYPDSGPGGALRAAAGLWLLAHGAELVRTGTLSGVPAPVGVTPLLLTVLPLLLLYRVARSAEGSARATVTWLSAGYLAVAALTCWFSASAALRVDLLSAAVRLPLVTVATISVGTWAARGRPSPGPAWRRMPSWAPWSRTLTAARGAGVAAAVLCGGGALLAAGALVWHGTATQQAFPLLTEAWSGRVAVLLLCVALAPNAAVWGAAYGLGPGFAVGTGSSVSPLAVGAHPQLPHFPLFAVFPEEGPGGPLTWALAAPLPLAAGVAAGWYTARAAVPVPGNGHGAAGPRATLATVVQAAVGCGLVMWVLAELAGGAMGSGRLAGFGPLPWLTGLVACGWTLVVAAPAALLVRSWRLRDPQLLLSAGIAWRRVVAWCSSLGPEPPEPPLADWHATGARQTRWAAIKQASGGLVPSFEPGSPTLDGSGAGTADKKGAADDGPSDTTGTRGPTGARRRLGLKRKPADGPPAGAGADGSGFHGTAPGGSLATAVAEPEPAVATTRAGRRAERRAQRRAERQAGGQGAKPPSPPD